MNAHQYCEDHVEKTVGDLYSHGYSPTFDGYEFGIRWANGDIGWFSCEGRAKAVLSGDTLLPGTLVKRRLVVGALEEVSAIS